jgi:hypothetical protein
MKGDTPTQTWMRRNHQNSAENFIIAMEHPHKSVAIKGKTDFHARARQSGKRQQPRTRLSVLSPFYLKMLLKDETSDQLRF